jgi:hypothetical protein
VIGGRVGAAGITTDSNTNIVEEYDPGTDGVGRGHARMAVQGPPADRMFEDPHDNAGRKPCSIKGRGMASKLSEPRGVIPGNCSFLDAQYSADCGERPTRFWYQGSGRETRQLL